MTSIYGSPFLSQVASARGKPANWGSQGHQGFNPMPASGSSYHPMPSPVVRPELSQNFTPGYVPRTKPPGMETGPSLTGPMTQDFTPQMPSQIGGARNQLPGMAGAAQGKNQMGPHQNPGMGNGMGGMMGQGGMSNRQPQFMQPGKSNVAPGGRPPPGSYMPQPGPGYGGGQFQSQYHLGRSGFPGSGIGSTGFGG